jgi:hypothetical protein
MKLIPDGIARKVSELDLLASEKAPKVLFVGGVVGMVGSTVLACRATLKLSETMDIIHHDLETARATPEGLEKLKADPKTAEKYKDETFDEKDVKKQVARIYVEGVLKVGALYAPSVILGGVSICALTKSHNLLQDRNLAITAAYAAVDTAYARYRERVVDRFGEEVDQELVYEAERVDIVDEETGEVTSEQIITDAPGARYFRWYDEESSKCWGPDPQTNRFFLSQVQNWANEKLRTRGHLFLNEVYSELGMKHTKAGSVVGWTWETGEEFVDFGILQGRSQEFREGRNGREGAIGLDFNVQGIIFNKMKAEED